MELRVYFTIPFEGKDQAKELGCRWDPERKKWYCIDSDKGKSQVTRCLELWPGETLTDRPHKIIDDKIYYIEEIDLVPGARPFTASRWIGEIEAERKRVKSEFFSASHEILHSIVDKENKIKKKKKVVKDKQKE